MPKAPQELLSTPETAEQLFDQKIRSKQTWLGRNMNLITDIDNVSQEANKISHNQTVMGPSNHAGVYIRKDFQEVVGQGTSLMPTVRDSSGNRGHSLIIEDGLHTRVSGIKFTGFVSLGSSGSVHDGNTIFTNCFFEGEIFIWGKAHFIGCTFSHEEGAQVVITNQSGAAANVYIIGCSRLNGGIYGGAGVTVIAETT